MPRKRKRAAPRRKAKPKPLLRLRHWLLGLCTPAVLYLTSCGTHLPTLPDAAPSQPSLTSFATCPQFFAHGRAPVVPAQPRLRALCFASFAVLHSGSTRTPVFVAERLNRALVLDADERRSDRFYAEARLPRAERAELADYRGSGFARGHMAPAGDMPNPTAMAQSFSLANMVPQNPTQNSGPWNKIEQDTRKYALRAMGDVYVITGPVFDAQPRRIGANGVAVPSHLFKLVYDAQTGRSWAHWQQNAADARVGAPISYGELVRRTGMELLPGVAPP